jgi:xylulose-5-phosphate/fructose-6-phosphate phosphoketolase
MTIITKDEINKLNDYWNALNYISVGELYLKDNPLLRRKLTLDDVKSVVVGHFGTVPGQNLVYTHLNRVIKKYDLNMIYISGPGHGGNSPVANTYLEGSYSEIYPEITQDEAGLQKLMKRFSFPGGISSHDAPETPGSINEGGELGYSISHAFGAILDNPDLIAAVVVGDGEAETGPLSASWQLNKFINPKTDGIVLPILHLNGFKINNPTILSRIDKDELYDYFVGLGWKPYYVKGSEPLKLHKRMAEVMDQVILDLKDIKKYANKHSARPWWPMIILETPKGMTGPEDIVGTYHSHQIPFQVTDDITLKKLETWLKSYHPENLFDKKGRLREDLQDLIPDKRHLMGLNPIANGGLLRKDLNLPDLYNYGIDVKQRGLIEASDMEELGSYLRDVFVLNKHNKNFRIFGPDEAVSNKLTDIFQTNDKCWELPIKKDDYKLNTYGRVMDSVLSEHLCEGALEGYILTGRHGIFHSYEAFIRIVDSMTSQHAKWLKVTKELEWREPISSLNYILTSHVWQQDHNGFTHQDPGFLNHLVTKKPEIVRMYLPIDANTLISTVNHMLQTKNYINVTIASKHLRPQWLTKEEAQEHCKNGIGIFEWASSNEGKNPDVILACAGDTPTLEVIAAGTILKEKMPELKFRVVNVIDLFRLVTSNQHPHGISNERYDKIFTISKPIIFAFHGYPSLIHELTYKRTNNNLHVRGYIEEGTITTPFDMRVQNKIDRYDLILDVLKYTKKKNDDLEDYCHKMLNKHYKYIREYGIDMPEVKNWKYK